MGWNAHRVRTGVACARALPPARPPALPARNALPNGRAWSPRQCARALRRSTPITARTRAAPRKPYTARPCGHVLRDARPCECRREDGCSGATLRTRERNDESMDDMRSSGCTIGVCLAHSHPHGIGACGRAQRRPVLWRRIRAFRASVRGAHDALNVAHPPRLKRRRTENGSARTEPPPAAVTPACRYACAWHAHATLEDAL